MKRSDLLLGLALVCALLGATLSAVLLSGHAHTGGALAAVCGEAESGCATALASRWAVFPPADAAALDGVHPPAGVPLAGLGLTWFALASSWLALVGRGGLGRAALVTSALAAAGSLVYVGLMASSVDAWCALCLGCHVANWGLYGALVALTRDAAPRPAPTARLALASALAGLALAAALWSGIISGGAGAENAELRAELAQLAEHGGLHEARYFADERFVANQSVKAHFDSGLRADDPRIPAAAGPSMQLVIFSDAECPGCQEFEQRLQSEVLPLFGGHLEVVYKHLPLADVHPNALPAARALEAARSQGHFFELKDALLARGRELGSVDYLALARELGMNARRFEDDMQSAATSARIEADLAHAARLGVTSTPALFLERRAVDRATRNAPGFWLLRANALRRSYDARALDW